eukprot:jgi/Chlat1/2559/Chrsp175S02410
MLVGMLNGWTPVPGSSKCYLLLESQFAYDAAEQACAERGAYLACIKSQAENDKATEVANNNLGLEFNEWGVAKP